MNNVITLNGRMFLSAYCDEQNGVRIPDEAPFVIGVIFSIVLPQIIFFSYGGLVPLIAFVVNALAGTIWGLVLYRKAPYRIISCISRGTLPQAPPSGHTTLKKAA